MNYFTNFSPSKHLWVTAIGPTLLSRAIRSARRPSGVELPFAATEHHRRIPPAPEVGILTLTRGKNLQPGTRDQICTTSRWPAVIVGPLGLNMRDDLKMKGWFPRRPVSREQDG